MNDDDIIESAEKIRLAEIKLKNDQEAREHDKWKILAEYKEQRKKRWHHTIHEILHPDTDSKGMAYLILFTIFLVAGCIATYEIFSLFAP